MSRLTPQERSARQRDLIRRVKPWLKATGPKTTEGHRRCAEGRRGSGRRQKLWASIYESIRHPSPKDEHEKREREHYRYLAKNIRRCLKKQGCWTGDMATSLEAYAMKTKVVEPENTRGVTSVVLERPEWLAPKFS